MKAYKTFVRNYLISTSLYDFVFAYAIYTILFQIRGLSVWQISLLLGWWSLSAMILEVPTGALADYWSRRTILVIAPIFKSLCFIIWYIAGGEIFLFGLGFFFWSFGSALKSGTSEALLYDELAAYDKKDQFEILMSRKNSFFHIALALSMISGGFMAHYNMDLVIIVSVIPLWLSSFFASRINQMPKKEEREDIHYFTYIKMAFQEMKSNKILLFFLIYSFGISVFDELEEFDQLYYALAGIPIYAYGIFGFAWSVLNSISSYYAYKLKRFAWPFFALPALSGLLLIYTGFQPGIPAIVFLLAAYSVTAPLKVLIDSKIQHSIKSAGRATVTSGTALLINFAGILLTLFFGFISRIFNLQAIYLASALILFVFSILSLIKRRLFKK